MAAYGADEFPAFFSRASGCRAPARVDSPAQAAALVRAAFALRLAPQPSHCSGIVIGAQALALAHSRRIQWTFMRAVCRTLKLARKPFRCFAALIVSVVFLTDFITAQKYVHERDTALRGAWRAVAGARVPPHCSGVVIDMG